MGMETQIHTPYQSIILIGRAGTGKGTQAAKLAEALGYAIFSTGDKTREYAAMDTPLGRLVHKIHTTGWIPEWLASYMMTKALLEDFIEQGLVFESVARKPEEAKKLHEIHEAIERPYVVIHLDCNDEELTERLLARGREGYDTPEKIALRREAFMNETVQSINFFTEQGNVKQVNADQTVDEVFADIVEAIKV
jgi:adenylate kinase